MRNFEIKNNQNGRSMIEMLGVLAIIGVLSVGGIAGYSKAMMKYRINKTIEQITLIAGNLRSFTASQPADRRYMGLRLITNYTSSSSGLNVIRKAKIVPDEFFDVNGFEIPRIGCTTGGTEIYYITNPFGGGVALDEHYNTMFMSFSHIPQEACIDIVSQDWSALNPENIYINAGMEQSSDTESHKYLGKLEDAITQCNEDYNIISFLIK